MDWPYNWVLIGPVMSNTRHTKVKKDLFLDKLVLCIIYFIPKIKKPSCIKWTLIYCFYDNFKTDNNTFFDHFVLFSQLCIMTVNCGHQQKAEMGGLAVKILACCAGGPGFYPWVENPKFWLSFGWEVQMVVSFTSVYSRQVKDMGYMCNMLWTAVSYHFINQATWVARTCLRELHTKYCILALFSMFDCS